MAKKRWRIVTWIGIAMAVGLGSSAFPNDFDMLFLMAGLLITTIGMLGMVTSSRGASPDE